MTNTTALAHRSGFVYGHMVDDVVPVTVGGRTFRVHHLNRTYGKVVRAWLHRTTKSGADYKRDTGRYVDLADLELPAEVRACFEALPFSDYPS